MIFRKPYAILIKNFKLIHTILTIIMCYSIYHTYEINHFFNEYMKTTMLPLGRGAAEELFSTQMYFEPFLIIGFSFIMLITMIKKEKPSILYGFLITIYTSLFFVYSFTNSKVLYLEENIMAGKDVRFLADITVLLLIPQLVLILFLLVRSIGFDIKKFDFKKDLLDMDIQETDNEEFEVSVSVDGNIFKRKYFKIIRHIKYLYLEHKMLFRILTLLFISYLSINLYNRFNLESVILKENGEAFTVGNVTLQITDSYVTKKDYIGKDITSGNYVVLRMLTKSSSLGQVLNYAKMQLKVGDNIYYPIENGLKEQILDLGRLYSNNFLTVKDFETYIIAYEIPLGVKIRNVTFRYIIDNNGEEMDIVTTGVKPKIIDGEAKTKNVNLNKEFIINENVLGESKVVIDSFEMNEFFIQKYNYCATTGDCFPSKEYIRPTLNSNDDKAILKINGELMLDEDYDIVGVENLKSFITKFGTLVYKKNNRTFKTKGSLSWVDAKKYKKKNEYFMEINKNVLDADEVYLLLQIRDKEYKINIKK